VVPQFVDRFRGLRNGPATNLTGIRPLQREVLPQQHTELVCSLVESGRRDVRMDAQEVESGVVGEFDVTTELVRRGGGEVESRRCEVRSLEEHPLAVDREDPVVHGDFS